MGPHPVPERPVVPDVSGVGDSVEDPLVGWPEDARRRPRGEEKREGDQAGQPGNQAGGSQTRKYARATGDETSRHWLGPEPDHIGGRFATVQRNRSSLCILLG
jgi:hypothetical protein